MCFSIGSLTNDLGEGCDIVLKAAFKELKRGAMSSVVEENIHSRRSVILEIRSS